MTLDEDHITGMLRAATACYSDGKLASVHAICAGIITLAPDDPRAHKLRAATYILERRHRDAESAYEAALKLEQNDPYSLVNLAEIKLRSLQFSAATALLHRLFALDPDKKHPAANRGRWLLQEMAGKLEHS